MIYILQYFRKKITIYKSIPHNLRDIFRYKEAYEGKTENITEIYVEKINIQTSNKLRQRKTIHHNKRKYFYRIL